MKTECINSTEFRGQVIKSGRKFSAKPKQCLDNTDAQMNDLMKSKHFDLYIHQDYSKNEIVFETDNVGVSKRIPVTATVSKYIEAAKNTIEEHEKTESAEKLAEWEKEQNKSELKDLCLSLLYFAALPFIVLAVEVKEGLKDLKINYNKLAKSFATKKG